MHFRVYRMKTAARETFRWSAHTCGHAVVKRNEYDAAEELQASSEYDAWKKLNEIGSRLFPGDVLEKESDHIAEVDLKIVKYIGFEPASWWIPLPKTNSLQENEPNSAPNCPEIRSSL